ncbi:MAG: hypothetical protein AB1508_01525 [Pseudomonadota bacterium]
MESQTKPTHRFSIWKLAEPATESRGRVPEGAAAKANSPAAEPSTPVPRPLHARERHSAVTAARATLRPFGAKCMLPNGTKLNCETKRVEPDRIEVAYREIPKTGRETGRESLLNAKVGLEIDFFGFVRGTVRNVSQSGFWMAPDIVYHEMLVRKLAELRMTGATENERSNLERLTARITLRNPACLYRLFDDPTLYQAKIALLSHKVATLRTAQIQRAGTRVLLGWPESRAGQVVRSFESGFTVELDEALEELHENLTFA